MSITGEPGRPPTRVGTSVGDITAALFGAIGILTALNVRHVTGLGQKVDVSMLDCQVAILENAIARYQVMDEVPQPLGARHPSIAPFESFPTKDYYVIIAAGNDSLWRKLCKALQLEQLAEDPRYRTNKDRVQHVDELYKLISEITVTKTTEEWVELLKRFDIPVGSINTIDKVVTNPQVLARDMIVEIKHPVAGPIKVAGNPIKLSATPGSIDTPAPGLGEHTKSVLKSVLNWSDAAIESYLKGN
jgi:CoA:oxalate CoA-transferase